MGFLKKETLAALGAGLLVTWLLAFLFLDALVRLALVRAGEAAAGAKVEVGSVKTRLLAGRAAIRRVAVADRSEPMKNLLEFDEAALELSPGALLRGSVVIPEAALTGLRFGTPRASSGALAKAPPPGPVEEAVSRQLGSAKASALSGAGGLGDDAKKAVAETKAKAAEVEARWKERLKAARWDADLAALKEEAKALKGGGSSPAELARKAKAASDLQGRIKGLLGEVASARRDAEKDLAEVKTLASKAEAGLPSLDAQGLALRLLGPAMRAKVQTALRWAAWAREKSGSASPAPPKPARRRGVDVEFPRAKPLPKVLVERARLSGRLSGLPGGKELELEGELTGATTDPKLHGKPARLTLKGGTRAGPALELKASLDATKAAARGEVELDSWGWPLEGLELGDGEVGGVLKAGAGRVSGRLALSGDEWRGKFGLQAAGVSLEPRASLEGQAGRLTRQALAGVKRFTAEVGVSGRDDDLKLTLTSDLGAAVASAMRGAVSGEVAARRKELEAEVKRLEASLLGPLDAKRSALEGTLKDAIPGVAKGLPDLKKLFGR